MSDPNVVFILTDQLRASAVGCYGNEQVQTPTIDSLGTEGIQFDQAYSPHPVCTPARGSIQTGCLKYDHRAIRNWVPMDTNPNRPTLGRTFRDAGYRTGYIGKWHLDGQTGNGETLTDPDENGPGFVPPGPRRSGYDFWRGFNDGHDHHDGHPLFTRDGEAYRVRDDEWQPTVQTDIARDFIGRNSEDPFFLFLSWGPPHPPFEAPEEYSSKYDGSELDFPPNVPEALLPAVRSDLEEYYGMIEAIDANLTQLLDTLEEEGLKDDTIVVFTSDHGELLGSHGVEMGKNQPYEEASHVPLLIRYPNGIDGGRHSTGLVSLVDLYPSLAGLCDLDVPEQVQGTNLSEHIRSAAPAPDEPVYLANDWRAVRTREYMLRVDDELQPVELYDLESDPYEQKNVVYEADPNLLANLLSRLIEQAYRFNDHAITSESFRLGSPYGPELDDEIVASLDVDYERYGRT